MHPHLEYLSENIFRVHTRWPHYWLNLDDMQALHGEFCYKRVLSLERSIEGTCGKSTGASRWLPLFEALTVVNHGMADAREHYALDDGILVRDWDLVMVPNLLHHVRDQNGFFSSLKAACKQTATLYIYDTVIHELHDVPHDYIRYTPYGIQDRLEREGFKIEHIRETGNHLSAIWYALDFAKEQYGESAIPKISDGEWTNMMEEACSDKNPPDLDRSEVGRRMCMYWSVRAKRVDPLSTS